MFTVDVVFPRAVQFFKDVEIVVTLVFRKAVGAEGLCRINRPGFRINGFYPLEFVSPINRPVAIHPDIAGQLPSFGTILVVSESAVMAANGDAVLLEEKDSLVVVFFARLRHIDNLYPALVGIPGDGHGLTVEEQFHTHLAVRPAVIPDFAVFVDSLHGKVGTEHLFRSGRIEALQHRLVGYRFESFHDLSADKRDGLTRMRAPGDRHIRPTAVLSGEGKRFS